MGICTLSDLSSRLLEAFEQAGSCGVEIQNAHADRVAVLVPYEVYKALQGRQGVTGNPLVDPRRTLPDFRQGEGDREPVTLSPFGNEF
jgi:hypothetical protein